MVIFTKSSKCRRYTRKGKTKENPLLSTVFHLFYAKSANVATNANIPPFLQVLQLVLHFHASKQSIPFAQNIPNIDFATFLFQEGGKKMHGVYF